MDMVLGKYFKLHVTNELKNYKLGTIPVPPPLPYILPPVPTIKQLPHIDPKTIQKPKPKAPKIIDKLKIEKKGSIDNIMKQILQRKKELNFHAPHRKSNHNASSSSDESSSDTDSS